MSNKTINVMLAIAALASTTARAYDCYDYAAILNDQAEAAAEAADQRVMNADDALNACENEPGANCDAQLQELNNAIAADSAAWADVSLTLNAMTAC